MSVRILHVTSSYPRQDDDPTGLFVADLVAAERRAGLDVSVVAPHDAGLVTDSVVAGAPVHRFRYGPDRWEVLAYRGGLRGSVRRPLALAMVPAYLVGLTAATVVQARRRQAEVIHAHWWFPAGLAALVASRLVGIPYVVTLHGSDVALARGRVLGWLARAVVGRAAAVTAVSTSLAAEATIVLRLGADRVAVLPMPVPPPGPTAGPTPTAPPPLRVLAVGRLAPEKGFDVLVRAAARLRAAGFAIEVEVIGAGSEEAHLRRLAGELGDHVQLLGALPRAAVHARMHAAHVVVLPSRREGLGLVAVEALALGRPVVASRVGGLVETVRDGLDGLLVEPDDPKALAAALRRCPLPAPGSVTVERHHPDTVAAAHAVLYADTVAEATAHPVRRWHPLRWLGALVALAVVVVLVRIAVHDWPLIRQAWRHPNAAALVLAVAAMAAAEVGFGLASAGALAAVAGRPVPRRIVAATFWVAQTAKNVPGGLWAALARAGLAAEWGVGARATLGWLATEAVASVAAGLTVAGLALAVAAAGGPAGLPTPVWALLAVLALGSPLLLTPGGAPARLFRRMAGAVPAPAQVGRAALAYLPVWVASGIGTAALCRAIAPLDGRALVLAGGAGCLASIAGFLAVPVPSGLGVREAVLVALLHPVLPTALGTSVALGSRVLALVLQTALAAAALPAVRRARPHVAGGA